jgi:lysophospholipase L1-like esterase
LEASLRTAMPDQHQSDKIIRNSDDRNETPCFRRLVLALAAVVFAGLGCSSGGGTPASTQGGSSQVVGGSGGNGQSTGGATGGAFVAGGSVATSVTGGSDFAGGVATSAGGLSSTGGIVVTAGSVSSGGTTPRGGTTATTPAGGSVVSGGSVSTGGTTSRGGTTASTGSGGSSLPAAGGQTTTTGCPALIDGPTPDATTRAKCTSGTTGITCHFGGNPGNYDVSFYVGGTAAGQTIVQAEHLREMLAAPVTTAGTPVAPIVTTAGQKVRYSMTVNVRQPEGQPEWSQASNGTPGLDMYFIGPTPQLDSIAYAPAAASDIVMYILTDSTGCDQEGPGTAGWGQWLPQFFGNGISVANYGNSGALSECSAATTPCRTDAPYYSFYDDPKMWPTVKPLLKAGDVVLIEFAHNDKNTPQAQFEANLNKYISETKAAGAIPILATPIPRNNWTNATTMSPTQLVNDPGVDLPATIRSVGAAAGVPVIDITAKTLAYFSSKGQVAAKAYYADPTTHLSTIGANIVAGLIRDEIKALNISPLVCYLR